MKKATRIFGLDFYRAIAIILVVHGHGKYMLENTPFENFPWIKLVDGVELFFVLSGFLIGGILIKHIHENNYSLSARHLLYFWKRRWFRTLPNYYLILLLNYLFVYFSIIDGNIKDFSYKFLFFTQNFISPIFIFWESWSLSIEEWFYIFLPILFFLFLFLFKSKKAILITILILILFPLFYRIYNSNEVVDIFWWDVKFRKIVLMRIDAIIYGGLAAYIKFYYPKVWKKYSIHTLIIGVLLTILLLYLPKNPNDFFTKTFYFNLTSIGAALLLPYANSVTFIKNRIGKVITHISIISYSMYLINLALVSQVISKNFPISSPSDGLMKYFIFWAIVILCSTVLYSFYEKPMTKLREKSFFFK